MYGNTDSYKWKSTYKLTIPIIDFYSKNETHTNEWEKQFNKSQNIRILLKPEHYVYYQK